MASKDNPLTYKIDAITPQLLKALRAEINDALAPIAQKYGIALAAGNASYMPRSFKFGLEGALPGDDGNVASVRDLKAAEDYKRYATSYGMKPEWLGREFSYGGRKVTLIGLMPKRTKFPILVKEDNGAQKLLPYEPVAALLDKEAR